MDLDWTSWLPTLAAGSLISLALTALLLPVVVLRLPPDYFRHATGREARRESATAWTGLTWVLRNVAGAVFVIAGLAMLLLPGQGLLTILVGLVLLDFPGKYALERRLVARPGVLRLLNAVRERFGKVTFAPPARPRGEAGYASGEAEREDLR